LVGRGRELNMERMLSIEASEEMPIRSRYSSRAGQRVREANSAEVMPDRSARSAISTISR